MSRIGAIDWHQLWAMGLYNAGTLTKRFWIFLGVALVAAIVGVYVWRLDEGSGGAPRSEAKEPDLSKLRSKSCPQCPEFLIEIKNLRSNPVDIFWVDFEGQEVYYATCAPGQVVNQPSSAVDAWILRESGKFVRAIENPPERITIEVK